jgi:predicted  nucleic acid-binding Zn-ribbon protein
MTQYPDDKALKEKLDALTTDIKELENKVKSLKTKPSLSEESVRAIRLTILNITKESDKRSKLYKNFMMLLSEHLDPKQLIVSISIISKRWFYLLI